MRNYFTTQQVQKNLALLCKLYKFNAQNQNTSAMFRNRTKNLCVLMSVLWRPINCTCLN